MVFLRNISHLREKALHFLLGWLSGMMMMPPRTLLNRFQTGGALLARTHNNNKRRRRKKRSRGAVSDAGPQENEKGETRENKTNKIKNKKENLEGKKRDQKGGETVPLVKRDRYLSKQSAAAVGD
jgi:hypothetical protein